MEALCDPRQPVPPAPFRGYCSSWIDEASVVSAECVAEPQVSVNLWSIFDDNGDGDFDIQDLAPFSLDYQTTPKLEQSEAKLAAVECCVPESLIREIGSCLSGPGMTTIPSRCDASTHCVYGFSAPLGIGDWHYTMCAPGPAVLPDPSTAHCLSWRAAEMPVAFSCRAAQLPGHSFFVIADGDGDGDVDLADFAEFQREFGLE